MTDALMARGLPKWPQMIVTGRSVTEDQAKEIIFRTDDFLTSASKYTGGNNHTFNERYRKAARLDRFESDAKDAEKSNDWMLELRFGDLVRERAGYISCNYVSNSWASCSFIFGAHGWCSPQGRIYFVDNVGKWPSIKEIHEDWKRLAEAFPFLQLNVTLMSGEECEDSNEPVVNIAVSNGVATVVESDLSVHGEGPHRRDFDVVAAFTNRSENGLPSAWVGEYAERVRKIVGSIKKADVLRNVG